MIIPVKSITSIPRHKPRKVKPDPDRELKRLFKWFNVPVEQPKSNGDRSNEQSTTKDIEG